MRAAFARYELFLGASGVPPPVRHSRNLTVEVLEYLDRAGYTRYAQGRRRMAQ